LQTSDKINGKLNGYLNMEQQKQKREAKLEGRCQVLAEIIDAIKPVYLKANNEQKAFIETMIGAAIWYIPKPPNTWTGHVSVGVLKAFHPKSEHTKPKFSEEHVYPRKMAAKLLLKDNLLNGEKLKLLFKEKYGRLHFITPGENKSVLKHQKAKYFTTPEDAYAKAGISLIKISDSDLPFIKKRDLKIIEGYLKLPMPS
jgi:hypothetical protein